MHELTSIQKLVIIVSTSIILVIVRIIRTVKARVRVCGSIIPVTIPWGIIAIITIVIVGRGGPIILAAILRASVAIIIVDRGWPIIIITTGSLVRVCGYVPEIRSQVFLGGEVILKGANDWEILS